MCLISDVEIKKTPGPGEEFIEWAERYWLLDKLIKVDNPDSFNGEACNYLYMRDVFIKKINSIIKERLSL